jgi:methanogenic corrinoid protein MtbC1
LIAARAMRAGFDVLKPAFADEQAFSRGVFVIGTVRGDLHDIGKNLVAIILEGSGWQIVDVGTDCPTDKFIEAIDRHPGCAVGLSALLTTTMMNMGETVTAIRRHRSETVVLVGGAPVTADFARDIGADGYGADPTEAIALLDALIPAS